MKEMRQLTNRSLSLFVGLLSSATAACSGTGQDGLVTVGIRPTVVVATSDRADAGVVNRPAVSGSNAMDQSPDDTRVTSRGADAGGSATSASVGSGTSTEKPPESTGAATAGAGAAPTSAAGAGGAPSASDANEDECGEIPLQPAGNVTSGRMSGPGLIEYDVDAPNVFTALRTTVMVPAEPPPDGPIFIWSGMQPTPNGMNYQPIGNGGLMPVLTWGTSACAQDAPASYSTWYIAPLYSNISSSDPQYSGCHSGKVTLAQPKQLIDIELRLDGTKWTENVVNRETMNASDFSIDLKGQAQGRVFFDIELQTSNKPTEDVIFTHTVLTMNMPDPEACQPVMRGMNDFASKPRVSADGKHCCIDRIVLRASGVAATTMDPE